MSFDPTLIAQARQEISTAPYGHKSIMAGKWAALIGVSYQSLYRLINERSVRRARQGSPINAEYREWTKIIFQIKKRPPEEAGEISTEDALAIAVKSAQLPEAALSVSVGTYNLIARKAGYTKKETRANRFQAERPNQAHHFDASTSKFFYIARRDGSDYILRMHRPAKHYKNKPVPVDALRPWIYGLTDDHSGRIISRYVAAQGENSADSMSFLSWAWSDIGLPEKLLADQGMLKKALPSRDLIERLGIELPEMMPYQKRGHGKIERPWRTAWQKFELPFFAVDNYEKFEISMTEMNQQLTNYINDKYNQLPHRFERDITRMQAWSRINLHGGIVQMPENALATVARRAKRKIDVTGKLEYPGGPYEVKGLYDAWVYVFEGVFDDKLVVQDIETGKKYEVRDFKPLTIDQYRAHTETPHQVLIKEDELQITNTTLYASAKPADEKVVSMPIRTKESREIADPFDVEHYANLQDAFTGFFEIVGLIEISEQERRELGEIFAENKLSKEFIRNIAIEARAWYEQRRRAAM